MDLVLADQVADGSVGNQHFERQHAHGSAGARQQQLAQHALEHEGELRAHLRLLMRRNLCIAEFVCSVANTKWPVSAMVSAASIVSRSRISPTSTTSGSWRSTYFSAYLKLEVSLPTSR